MNDKDKSFWVRSEKGKPMTELKPCPFCGCKEIFLTWVDGDFCVAECFRCGARGCFAGSKDDAKRMWNRRVEDGKAD